jgi:murein L,D-transpeptidase YafK
MVAAIDMQLTPRKIEAAPAQSVEPLPLPVQIAPPPETIQQALAGWAAAWSSKDFPRYRGYYAKRFTPEDGHSPEQWASERAIRLSKPGDITIGVSDLQVSNPDANQATTEFKQTYTSASYRDAVTKRMEWVREGDRWKIQREQTQGVPKVLVPELMKTSTKQHRASKLSKPCVCN